MTKEITKAFILQQIQDKLALREYMQEKFLFSETVVPTYNIGQHLLTAHSIYKEKSVTGTGNLIMFSMGQTSKRTFSRYDVIFMGAGGYTVAGVNVTRKGDADSVYLDLKAAQSASYHVDLKTPIKLYPGDILSINIDGYTSTQDLRFYYDYTEEIIR